MATMNGNGEYTPIPDVEQPVTKEIVVDPKDKYPGTTDEQAIFLAQVDACVEESRLVIPVEYTAPEYAFCKWTVCVSLCLLILWFLAFFGVAVYVGFSRVYHSHFLTEAFPYIAAGLLYLVSCFIIDGRIMGHSVFALVAVKDLTKTLSTTIDGTVQTVIYKITAVQLKLVNLLVPIKSTMTEATASEAAIQKIDPSVESIGIGSIETELDDAPDRIQAKTDEVKAAVDTDTIVPAYLQGAWAYRCRVVIPLLLFYLVLQMVAAYGYRQIYPKYFAHKHITIATPAPSLAPTVPPTVSPIVTNTTMTTNATSTANFTNAVLATVLNDTQALVNQTQVLLNDTQVALNVAETAVVQWVAGGFYFALSVVLAFLVALLQVLLVLCCTGMSSTFASIQTIYDNASDTLNRLAREKGLTAAVEDGMANRMVVVRTKFLQLLDSKVKIDAALVLVAENAAKAPSPTETTARAVPVQATVTVDRGATQNRKPKKPKRQMSKKQSSRLGRFFGQGKA